MGDIGGATQFQFTVVGDTVNVRAAWKRSPASTTRP